MPELTVANFNTHAGTDGWGRPFDLVEACRRLEADVLVLEETFTPLDRPGQGSEIAEALGLHLAELELGPASRRIEPIWDGAGWEPRRASVARGRQQMSMYVGGRHLRSDRIDLSGYEQGALGIAVLSRHLVAGSRILDFPALRRDFTPRKALVAELGGAAKGFTVVGMHAAHLTHGSIAHFRELAADLGQMDGPAAVLGDMNLWGPPLVALLRGWRRAVKGATWPAWRPHSQIDHILVSEHVRVLGGDVLRVGDSDHLAVRGRLAWD